MTGRPSFVRIIRDTGTEALVRPDAITHILKNDLSKKGEDGQKVMVPGLSIHLGSTLVIHTEMTEEALLEAMSSAGAQGKIVVIDPPA